MKPLNKSERWYIFLYMFITADFKAYHASGRTGDLIAAGGAIKDKKRHKELQIYGAYLRHETHE